MDELEQVAGCDDGRTCDGVFIDRAGGKVIVRGQVSTLLPLGAGEVAVEMPLEWWENR